MVGLALYQTFGLQETEPASDQHSGWLSASSHADLVPFPGLFKHSTSMKGYHTEHSQRWDSEALDLLVRIIILHKFRESTNMLVCALNLSSIVFGSNLRLVLLVLGGLG